MIYKLLGIRKVEPEVNIGDYVQALASSQFYPQVDGFVERDELSLYTGEPCKIIMNGWFMAKPEHWPPPKQIEPLFVAFHINSKAKDAMLKPESISYLKQYEPIGCRDTYSRDLLREKGVDAYFSGCMTLTLGRKYESLEKDDKVYFVDPYFLTRWNWKSTIRAIIFLCFHFLAIARIARKYPERKSFLRKCMILTGFYREYRKFFSEKILVNATYICQQDRYYSENFSSDVALLGEAERLVKLYAKARLVVTSRIHCALPCLGMRTPVIFTENADQSEASACRFGGLRELFNVLSWRNGHLEPNFVINKVDGTNKFDFANSTQWEVLAKELSDKCLHFVKASYE